MRTNNLRQLIRKCPTLTLAVQTSPTARLHLHHHGGALRRQVLKVSEISAVPTSRRLVASGTQAYFRSRGRDHPPIAIPLDSKNPHARPRSPIHFSSHARLSARRPIKPTSTETEADPSIVRTWPADILTIDGQIQKTFHILIPRRRLTARARKGDSAAAGRAWDRLRTVQSSRQRIPDRRYH
jgi:hypothetical protein